MDPSDDAPMPAALGPWLVAPLLSSRVPAGFPSPADDHQDQGLDLSRRFLPRPTSTFFIRVSGESLTGIGIRPGDFLAVDKSRDPHDGDVVLALVDGDFTTKRYRCAGGRILLASENPACPSIPWREGCEVWGVVTSVHRDLMSAG